ncbi:hypothetical protein IFM47457_00022 [Aspergillus lentulus]|nr:hypothetical protein IFM47457_00022 [Aspergillus lentulus]
MAESEGLKTIRMPKQSKSNVHERSSANKTRHRAFFYLTARLDRPTTASRPVDEAQKLGPDILRSSLEQFQQLEAPQMKE